MRKGVKQTLKTILYPVQNQIIQNLKDLVLLGSSANGTSSAPLSLAANSTSSTSSTALDNKSTKGNRRRKTIQSI